MVQEFVREQEKAAQITTTATPAITATISLSDFSAQKAELLKLHAYSSQQLVKLEPMLQRVTKDLKLVEERVRGGEVGEDLIRVRTQLQNNFR